MASFTFARGYLVPFFVVVSIAACDRERVEVAEPAAPDASVGPAPPPEAKVPPQPSFPMDAGPIDAGCAMEIPPVGLCGECPKGYKQVDGVPTCDCCE